MNRIVLLLGSALVAVLLSGCEPPAASSTIAADVPPGPPAPPAAASEQQPEIPAAPAVNEENAGTVENQPVAPADRITAQQPSAAAGSSRFVNLSAGVAVPQLLPEGTQIGVSVDYTLSGSPKSSCRYLLVVESKEGDTPVPIKLDPQGGTFQGFLPPSVRPEHQPFRARIDEVDPQGGRVRISNSAVLATSY